MSTDLVDNSKFRDPKWDKATDFPSTALPKEDSKLQQLMQDAGLQPLAAGPGCLRQDTAGCLYQRGVRCEQYVPGQETGHHAILWRRVVSVTAGQICRMLLTSAWALVCPEGEALLA